jgi:hypothetical protein
MGSSDRQPDLPPHAGACHAAAGLAHVKARRRCPSGRDAIKLPLIWHGGAVRLAAAVQFCRWEWREAHE